jgi:hypothetical protein
MQISNVTFRGPPIDDESILESLPGNLRVLLRSMNGFIQRRGGLHVRGACAAPNWHSLRTVLEGEFAFHALYEEVELSDVPFAQDCVGDQFLLREGSVCRLAAETGEISVIAASLPEFFAAAAEDPIKILGLHPLIRLEQEGRELAGRADSCLSAVLYEGSGRGRFTSSDPRSSSNIVSCTTCGGASRRRREDRSAVG